ncbi:MAG: hypothetical protein H0W65_02475 [Sphingomonas sp.]|uniref:hypothetical protein n=1 Tax=Sphingomonas sp. TaxID=28214 RepID=UPI00185064DE|nr:hypothetical protein [Sphingomonas sp.]MBA3666575.1 hypothetical protein [Sphingomonas sp.]
MADAGVLKEGDRLPWLEPYRAPVEAKAGRGKALAAAGLIAIAGVSSSSVVRMANVTTEQPAPAVPPQASVLLPAPDAMKLDVPIMPIKVQVVPAPARGPLVHRASISAASSRRTARPKRRIVTAVPDRISYESILSEQIAIMPRPAPILQLAPAPVLPLRPTVNPNAAVTRGRTAQLGVYLTARQAETAWRSAIKDYTFLVTMPKNISPVRFGKSSRRFYRLQLGTPSHTHAQQLCLNLRQTGRACTVA